MATHAAVPHRRSFKNLADFAMAVRRAAESDHALDPRLSPQAAAPSTYGSEQNGADGAYLVPPDLRSTVVDAIIGETALLGLTDRVTTQSNSVTIPADASPSWLGIVPAQAAEGTLLAQQKLAMTSRTVKLGKVEATLPVSNELFEDSVGLDAFLRFSIPERLNFKVTDLLINGKGINGPLGVLNSPALITQAAEGAQPVGTLMWPNIQKMWARLYSPSKARAVWVMHSTVEQALLGLTLPPGVLTYPAGSPCGYLYGRPMLISEACQTIGTPGDILLIDPKAILSATREGEVKADVSMHVFFDLDLSCYRFVMRVGVTPWWSSTVVQKNGGVTVSTAVALATR